MRYNIKQKNEPLYLSIYKSLREDIVNGVYKNGEKLPSKRVLAERLGVSVITVENAYALLSAEGYIETVQKSGYFCIYDRGDRFLSAAVKPAASLPEYTSVGEAAFPFGVYAKTVRTVLSAYGDKIFAKCEPGGSAVLRAQIADYLSRSRGISVNPDRIFIGAGAEYLYGLIVELLGRDKVYAAEKPSYEKIEQVYAAKGVKCEMLPLSADGIKSSALKNTSAQVLHITPYRSFPSGVTASPSKRMEYISWAGSKNRYILEDDFESELTVTGKIYDTVFSLSDADNVIYLNTFTKTVSPAVRTAYMVLPEKLAGEFKEKLGFYSCTVPVLDQLVVAELLRNGEFERHINRVRRAARRESASGKQRY